MNNIFKNINNLFVSFFNFISCKTKPENTNENDIEKSNLIYCVSSLHDDSTLTE